MTNSKLWQQYKGLLEKADFIITYSALSDEIAIEETPNFAMLKDKPKFVVPPTHKIAPKAVAREIVVSVATACTLTPVPSSLVFLPGQKFDLTGTRQGRGFGWYDRLLAELPTEWTRVGIAKEAQVSKTPFKRNPWDQPVDWLIWKEINDNWNIAKIKKSASIKKAERSSFETNPAGA